MKHIALTFAIALAACTSAQSAETPSKPAAQLSGQTDTAILAGGCFWCVESDFEKLPGVYEAVSGYTGDDMANPTYRNHGQHVEAAKITFDPTVISYDEILDYYWRHIKTFRRSNSRPYSSSKNLLGCGRLSSRLL